MTGHAQNGQNSQKSSKLQKMAILPKIWAYISQSIMVWHSFPSSTIFFEHKDNISEILGKNIENCAHPILSKRLNLKSTFSTLKIYVL